MKKFIFFLVFFLFGCNAQLPVGNVTAYPLKDEAIISTAYPKKDGEVIENLSAFESYTIAKDVALQWNSEAILYKIPATFIMERNLGYPVTGEGWFFMFKTPNSSLEYYVYVWQGKVSGTTEAQPIQTSGNGEIFNSLKNLDGLIDSEEVIKIAKESGVGEENSRKINLELVFEQNANFPHWIVYDYSKSPEKIILKINAVNGEVIMKNLDS